ncbi:MAG: type 1 glutamine amidotransferase domain-containing protein [Candidatus Thermoplasmatota archaeon]
MSKVAVLVDEWFEDSEYTKPKNAFIKSGHKIVNVGLKKGKIVQGKRNKAEVKIDLSIKDAKVDDFDALLIPGGYSPDKLRAYEKPVDFVKGFFNKNKPVFAICHAPQLLISAKVLDGKNITGWKSIIQDIKNAGANFLDKKVVIDDNLVSSRSPKDLQAFIKKSLEKLEK